MRHGGGKGGFKWRERARRRGSSRGRVGGGVAANFYGEAAAPDARDAPWGRGEGGGGNGCSSMDEREMGQKKGMERWPAAFQAARWHRAERGKREWRPCGCGRMEKEEEEGGGGGG
jgi:hypothetical protein